MSAVSTDTTPSSNIKTQDQLNQLTDKYNASSKRKVALKEADMSEQMIENAVQKGNEIMDIATEEREIAHQIKTHFDINYTPGPWHCIVGRKYGARVTHETGHFLYMHLGNQAIMLFKAKSPVAK